MKKRNLFAELTEGFEALAAEREGKITLKRHTVESRPAPDVSAKELTRPVSTLTGPERASVSRTSSCPDGLTSHDPRTTNHVPIRRT